MKTPDPAAMERFRERLLSLPAEDLATLVVVAAIALDDLEMPEDIAGQLGIEKEALSEWEARVLHAGPIGSTLDDLASKVLGHTDELGLTESDTANA
ncbi:hypothetical protein [Ectopseudomonas mendocina]|nr:MULTISPECIES: hypothetical protein [Pseudomonas aeruginosa group]